MTLSKLAERAGVSVSTVSKAFSGANEISTAVRERIFAIAKEEGCFDKYYKAPRSHPMVALLAPEPESMRYSREMGLLERAFNAHGVDTLIAFTRFDPEKEEQLFRELVYGMKVDGVVLLGAGRKIKNPDEHPFVVIGGGAREACPENADTVVIDLDEGFDVLAETLKKYGHKSVGFLGEGKTRSSEMRLKNAMRRVGLPIHERFFFTSLHRFEAAGEEGMRKLIQRDAVPDVIVTAYNEIAYGAIKEARAQGYRIPEDISFVGAFDTPAASYFDIPLTALLADLESACEEIVSLLLLRIKNKHYRARTQIRIPVRMNIRASLACKT